MKRLGVFVDINDMYQCVKTAHNSKLDYGAYYDFLSVLGKIEVANAYGCHTEGEAQAFVRRLHRVGFKSRYRRVMQFAVETEDQDEPTSVKLYPVWDCGLTIDAVSSFAEIDMLVLGASSNNFLPLVKYAQEQGKTVVVFANCVDRMLAKTACEVIEIPASLLIK